MISDTLSWKSHIEYISKKVAKSVGILSRLSRFLYKKNLLNLYHSLVYPYLIYCNEVWGLSYTAQRKKLFSLQKRALRIICGKRKYYTDTGILTRSEPLFKDLKVMKIHDVTNYLIVFSYSNFTIGNFPESLIKCSILIVIYTNILQGNQLIYMYLL